MSQSHKPRTSYRLSRITPDHPGCWNSNSGWSCMKIVIWTPFKSRQWQTEPDLPRIKPDEQRTQYGHAQDLPACVRNHPGSPRTYPWYILSASWMVQDDPLWIRLYWGPPLFFQDHHGPSQTIKDVPRTIHDMLWIVQYAPQITMDLPRTKLDLKLPGQHHGSQQTFTDHHGL